MTSPKIHYQCSTVKSKKWMTRIVLMVCVLFISACSGFQLFYSQLDRAVVWRTTDYIDLDGDDRDWLKAKVREQQQTFEDKQLNEVIRLFDDASLALQSPFNQGVLDQFEVRGQQLLDDFLLGLLPTTTLFLKRLDENQLQQLSVALEESNNRRWEDYIDLSLDEQRVVWSEKLQEGLEDWVGALQDQQTVKVIQLSTKIQPLSITHQDFRIKWQRVFLATVNNFQQSNELMDELMPLFLQPERWHHDEHSETVNNRKQLFSDFFIDFMNSMSSDQKNKALERLNTYKQELQEIDAKGHQ